MTFQHISPCKELRERRPAAHFPADVPEIGLEVYTSQTLKSITSELSQKENYSFSAWIKKRWNLYGKS